MKFCIPGEMWNQVEVPTYDTAETNVSTLLSELAYKLPHVTDLMMTKELWHAVCDLSLRLGALRQRVTGTLSNNTLNVVPSAGTSFLRFVGAGIGSTPISLANLTTAQTSSGYSITFDSSVVQGASAYADISKVPDMNALPNGQKVPLWFIKAYKKSIVSYAIMRICSIGGKKWSDMASARVHAEIYFGELSRLSHGLVTSGMRKNALIDAGGILVSGVPSYPAQPQGGE